MRLIVARNQMQTSYWNNLVNLVRNYGPSQPYYLSFKIRLQLTESSCNNSRTSTWLKICGVSSKAARLTPGLGYSQSWCSMWSPPTSTRCSEHSPTSHSYLWIFQSPGYLWTYLMNQDWVHAVVPRRSGSPGEDPQHKLLFVGGVFQLNRWSKTCLCSV